MKPEITAKELAKKWGITPRRITQLAESIRGARQIGRGNWLFPANCSDPRKKVGRPKKSLD